MTVRALRRGSIAASRVTGPPPVTNVLSLPGTSGNYASTPDSVGNSITSDIDVRVQVACADWDDANEQTFMAKFGTAGDRAWIFRKVSASSALEFAISADGSSSLFPVSTVPTGFVAGSVHWIRVTWDNAADLTTFYTSDDGTTWTQLGSTVATARTGIFDSAAAVEIGSAIAGASNPLVGKIYKAELRDGIGGTVVQSFDATAVTKLGTRNPTTVAAGGPWTINGSDWDWAAP